MVKPILRAEDCARIYVASLDMVCGDIMTMPGLPKVPSANKIDLVDGKVVGLF